MGLRDTEEGSVIPPGVNVEAFVANLPTSKKDDRDPAAAVAAKPPADNRPLAEGVDAAAFVANSGNLRPKA